MTRLSVMDRIGFTGIRDGRLRWMFQIWLDDVQCPETASNFDYCNHKAWGDHHDRSEEKDVYIDCRGEVRKLRLTGHDKGRLDVYYHGRWGMICDDNFHQNEVRVACRQLGFPESSIFSQYNPESREPSLEKFWLDEVTCPANATNLDACEHNAWGDHNCQQEEAVYIECQMENNLRLSENSKGRLDIYHQGRWGMICNDGFTSREVRVACRQLGFPESNLVSRYIPESNLVSRYISEQRGTSLEKVWLADVTCPADATNLDTCNHSTWGQHNCSRHKAVFIECGGELRLNGNGKGRLDVYYRGRWGMICGNGFSTKEARVACRQLGFPDSNNFSIYNPEIRESPLPKYWLDNVNCTANSMNLDTCSHRGWGQHRCSSDEGIYIDCGGELRLSGKDFGRLDVHHNGSWGMICDNDFSKKEARVACRQLGFSESNLVSVYHPETYEPPLAKFWLDGVNCPADATDLDACRSTGWGDHNCTLEKAVYIECQASSFDVRVIIGLSVGAIIVILVIIVSIVICLTPRRKKPPVQNQGQPAEDPDEHIYASIEDNTTSTRCGHETIELPTVATRKGRGLLGKAKNSKPGVN